MNDPQFEVGNKAYDNAPGFTPEPPRRERGCFFYGCVIASVLFVIGLILAGALTYTIYYYYTKAIHDYTSTTPEQIPQVNMPEDRRKELNERVDAYTKAGNAGEAYELVLTADEINTLINENEDLKGKAYITIKGDQVTGKLSIPLEQWGLPGTKGRYFNGTATLKASIQNGQLDVRAQDLVVNDKPLPPNIKASLANENLAKDFSKDPGNAKMIAKIDSFEIKDDKVYIKTKAKAKDEDRAKGKGSDDAEDTPKPKADTKDDENPKDDAPTPKDEPKPEVDDTPKEPGSPKKAA